MTNHSLTAVPGISVGHHTHTDWMTGCTVILCPAGTVGGVDQRGGAPGTRETDLLRPMHLVEHVDAIVLSGGSAFGLRTADGVMQYLREQGRGYATGSGVAVPIVPAAILYDLEIGEPKAPSADDGYTAAASAAEKPVQQGSVGAGTGCRIGTLGGNARATKGGLGSASITLPSGVTVAALFAVNCVGDIVADDGTIIGGLRGEDGGYVGTLNAMRAMANPPAQTGNTVIGVVATNANLTKEQVNKVAQMAHDGLARAVRPAHTMYDGDTIFALATGQLQADVNVVGAFAAEVTATAIRSGIQNAESAGGVRAASR